jgi:formylglycine-generating enzyme required for sulfatase activity
MYGLVAEWCADNYRRDFSVRSTQFPYYDDTDIFCHRGGSWFTESDSTRSSSRGYSVGTKVSDGIGLRLVWEPD